MLHTATEVLQPCFILLLHNTMVFIGPRAGRSHRTRGPFWFAFYKNKDKTLKMRLEQPSRLGLRLMAF